MSGEERTGIFCLAICLVSLYKIFQCRGEWLSQVFTWEMPSIVESQDIDQIVSDLRSSGLRDQQRGEKKAPWLPGGKWEGGKLWHHESAIPSQQQAHTVAGCYVSRCLKKSCRSGTAGALTSHVGNIELSGSRFVGGKRDVWRGPFTSQISWQAAARIIPRANLTCGLGRFCQMVPVSAKSFGCGTSSPFPTSPPYHCQSPQHA